MTCSRVVLALALATCAAVALEQQDAAWQGPAAQTVARTPDGKPNLNGLWQVVNSANWDLEAHSAEEGIPGGLGVVEGGPIPYLPAALKQRDENRKNRRMADPVVKCFVPGVPR